MGGGGKGASPSPACQLPQSLENVGTARLNTLLRIEHRSWREWRQKSFCETDHHGAWFSFPRRRNNSSGVLESSPPSEKCSSFQLERLDFCAPSPRGADGSSPVLLRPQAPVLGGSRAGHRGFAAHPSQYSTAAVWSFFCCA